jgi:hypothetical protein
VGKLERKRPLARPRRRWEDNTKNGSLGNKMENLELTALPQSREK